VSGLLNGNERDEPKIEVNDFVDMMRGMKILAM